MRAIIFNIPSGSDGIKGKAARSEENLEFHLGWEDPGK